MEETTNKSGMSTGMIVGIAVIVAIVFGGGAYAYVNNKATKEKKDLNAQITELQSQVTSASTSATTATDETASWKTYTNSRVGYSFKYPTTNLTLALDESIKYPSARDSDSKTEDLVQFAVGKTSFGIRTYVGEGKGEIIESWIEKSNTPRAYHDLSKYEKVTVGGKIAYRTTGDAFIYVLANGNVYEITGYEDVAPVKISAEPLFEKWVATIQFTK